MKMMISLVMLCVCVCLCTHSSLRMCVEMCTRQYHHFNDFYMSLCDNYTKIFITSSYGEGITTLHRTQYGMECVCVCVYGGKPREKWNVPSYDEGVCKVMENQLCMCVCVCWEMRVCVYVCIASLMSCTLLL